MTSEPVNRPNKAFSHFDQASKHRSTLRTNWAIRQGKTSKAKKNQVAAKAAT